MVLRKHELEGKLGEESRMIKSGVLRDENPLDQSPKFAEFLLACRLGDLRKCQELMNQGVNINGKDKFDYTPLIIASLCGHYELVQLLLESGALAERNTFQGERCIYNALNDRIRNLLMSYDFSKSSDPYVYWSAHISSLLNRDKPRTADISLATDSHSFDLHRFLLSARTPFFRAKLEAQPETTIWHLSPAVPVEAVRIVLRFLYLEQLPRDLAPPDSDVSEETIIAGLGKISRQLEVEPLWEALLAGGDRRLARQRYQDEEARALQQIGDFFQQNVLERKILVDTNCVGTVRWKHDNPAFADVLLRADDEVVGSANDEAVETPEAPLLNGFGISTGMRGSHSQNHRLKKAFLYPAHKAMLIRSPYFGKMFSSDFLESQPTEHLKIITVDCSPAVLELVLRFLYTEKVNCPLELALDLLYTADMLFLDGLKNKAAVAISTLGSITSNKLAVPKQAAAAPFINPSDSVPAHGQAVADAALETDSEPINIYDVLHAAWDLGIRRLEEFAARYLAARLEDYIADPDFAALIGESAARLQSRQETDTIELLDDIRYYLSERFRLRFADTALAEFMADPDDLAAQLSAAQQNDDSHGVNGPRDEGDRSPSDTEAHATPAADDETAEDEFAADAANYQMLLGKIDDMLLKLKLDA